MVFDFLSASWRWAFDRKSFLLSESESEYKYVSRGGILKGKLLLSFCRMVGQECVCCGG